MTAHRRQPRGAGEDFAPDLSRDFDAAALGRRLLRNWYWFVLAVAVCVVAAWLYLRYTVPTYRATAEILIASEEAASPLSTEALGRELGFETSYDITAEMQVLGSRTLMRQVVDSLELNLTYVHLGDVRETDLYRPETFAVDLADSIVYDPRVPVRYGSVELIFLPDGSTRVVRGEADTARIEAGGLLEIGNRYFTFRRDSAAAAPSEAFPVRVAWRHPDGVAAAYAAGLGMQQVERSDVVDLSFVDSRPERAEDLLATLIYFYDLGIAVTNARVGAQTLEFIDERVAEVRRELFDVETRLEAYKRDQNLAVGVAGTAEDFLGRLNESDEQLAELQIRGEIIEEILRIVTDPANEYEPIPLSSEIIDGVLASLIEQYNLLIFEREQTLESATTENIAVATYSERIDNLRGTLVRSLRSLRREASERESRIRERIQPIEAGLTAIPESERVLIQLTREQEIKQALYIFLSERREETAISVAANVGNTRVIESAAATDYPIWPHPTPIYALAVALGLLVPATVMGASELLDGSVRTTEQVKAATSVPVLGTLIEAKKSTGLAVKPAGRTATAEQFRLLRTNLTYLIGKQSQAVVMVTSGSSAEGKSYVTANLGAAAALAKQRVLIVEADVRRPSLLKELGVKQRKDAAVGPGLIDVLTSDTPLAEATTPTGIAGLDVLGSGNVDAGAADVLMSGQRLAPMIAAMREVYDLVIFDTAPVGLVTDALVLGEYADATVYVVRYGYTPRRAVAQLEELTASGRLPQPGVVLNGVKHGADGSYGNGYGYYQRG